MFSFPVATLRIRHVINLVIDNWAQWFVVVPGAINLVQGPANYEALLRMGVPPDQVRIVPCVLCWSV